MNKLERAQEFLSNIEDYLRNTLADEKLSASAQIRRRHLLDKFYALELQANVEHKPGSTSSCNQTNAHAASQQKVSSQNTADCCKKGEKSCCHRNSIDDVEDFYEVPVACGHDDTTSNGKDSDTEYESYNEDDDDEEAFYMNQGSELIGRDEIHLPKSKRQINNDNVISSVSIKFTGELYRKGILSWSKCYCVLTEHALICYRAGKDSKILAKTLLSGCQTSFLEKEGKYCNLIRIARPGSENWFYAESKDAAEKWITHLSAVGCKELADKTMTENREKATVSATVATKNDSVDPVLTNATLTDGQANLSGGSSEGSGDGVIQSHGSSSTSIASTQSSQSVDKRRKSKLGESLQTLLATFGKKKGDKLKRALNEACAIDPETRAAGYVNICSELAEDKKWVKRFCVVKNNRLDCYKDPLDEYIEFSLALYGAQIDLIDKSRRTIKIVQDVKEVLLSAFVDADSGRWLGILLRESGFGSQLAAGRLPSASEADASSIEGIYDEVYNWEVYDIGDKQKTSAAPPPPPPLPRGPPPKVPPQQLPSKLLEEPECEYIEPTDFYDHMFDDDLLPSESLGLEEALNSAFFNIWDGLNKKEGSSTTELSSKSVEAKVQSGRSVRSTSQSPASKHKDLFPRCAFPVGNSPADNANGGKALGVVKRHTEPTIAEDKALLETTQNPILTELRRERQMKGSGKAEKSKLENRIEDLRRECEEIKKKRSDVRESLQTVESSLEKAQLAKEIVRLDKQLEITDKEVTKLSTLAQELDGKSFFRSESLWSSSAGRGVAANSDGDAASPTFIHLGRNSSLRETSSSAVHRTASSASLDQKFSTNSASSSPLRDRKVTSKASSEIPTGNISNLRSTADGKETSTSRTSSAFTVVGTKLQHTVTSRSCVSDKLRLQDGKLDGSGTVKTSMAAGDSTQMLSGCALVKERLANASSISSKSQCDKNQTVDISSSSDSKSTSGKVVQDKLKLWESMSDAGTAS